MPRLQWIGLASALAVGLAGCGQAPSSGGDATLTARGVAAVMLDHLPDDTSRREATFVDEHSPEGLVGADLRYGGDGESDGDLVRVTVSRGEAPECEERCVELGERTFLLWDEESPEEDPGIVVLVQVRRSEIVQATSAGAVITADPRKLDLSPSVETLTGLVRDERLSLRTTQAVVDAGAALDSWAGGEVAEGALDRVPHSDRSIVVTSVGAYGDDWEYVGPAPVKAELGAGAIAGRLKVGPDMEPVGPGIVDVFAAPTAPAWAKATCRDGFRCADLGNLRDPADDGYAGIRLVWRAASGADPGEAFYVNVREDGSVAGFHTRGPRLSADPIEAAGNAGLFLWGDNLLDETSEQYVSLTTTRQDLAAAARA